MPDVEYVYWRDIPAQVIVGKGRTAARVVLSDRFAHAIDRCAMKVGAKDTESYLSHWRRQKMPPVIGTPSDVAAELAGGLEREFDTDRLRQLIADDGWARGG